MCYSKFSNPIFTSECLICLPVQWRQFWFSYIFDTNLAFNYGYLILLYFRTCFHIFPNIFLCILAFVETSVKWKVNKLGFIYIRNTYSEKNEIFYGTVMKTKKLAKLPSFISHWVYLQLCYLFVRNRFSEYQYINWYSSGACNRNQFWIIWAKTEIY